MNGKPEVIAALNQLLTGELTAMDVYFVQSRMCDNWGYTKLSARLGHEVTDETRHADALIKRILFLGGQPDVASRAPFSAGKDVPEMLRFDPDGRPPVDSLGSRCEDLADDVGGKNLSRWRRRHTWPSAEDIQGALSGRTITEASISQTSRVLPSSVLSAQSARPAPPPAPDAVPWARAAARATGRPT